MLDVALAHARRGLRVFPVKEKNQPLIQGWQHAATTDETAIRALWTQWPDANVAVECSGLLVVDCDEGKGGFESLAKLDSEIGLEATYEVETPRLGRHLYYKLPPGTAVRNGVDVLGPGLDVRTAAGYCLAAGSRTAAGEYRIYADEPIAEADPVLIARCGVARSKAERQSKVPIETDEDAAVARAVEWLQGQPPAISGQGGDHKTFAVCARLRDFGVPKNRAAEALEVWNSTCVPPWDENELSVKIENAWHYSQDAAGKLTPEALGFKIVPESATESRITSDSQTGGDNELLHPADVMLDSILGVDYLIKGVLERQSNAVLFGSWGVGKTFCVLDMAAAIVTGERWFGKRVRQGRVLYLGYEGIRAMKKRLVALRGKHPKLAGALAAAGSAYILLNLGILPML